MALRRLEEAEGNLICLIDECQELLVHEPRDTDGEEFGPNQQLIVALSDGDLDDVLACLSAGADPNYVDPSMREPVLFQSFLTLEFCRALLDAGSSVFVVDGSDRTPVQAVCKSYLESDRSDRRMFGPGYSSVLTMLLDAGASPQLGLRKCPKRFRSIIGPFADALALQSSTVQVTATAAARRL